MPLGWRARRLPSVLFATYVVVWGALAVAPWYREDWLAENILVFLFVPAVVRSHRRAPYNTGACVGLFAFFVLHAIGSHYTYSQVPYATWWQALTGAELTGRNHFDRFVHFGYGLLVTPLLREWIARSVRSASPAWGSLLALSFAMAQSLVYELIEWGAAVVLGGELGAAYLGTQGDPWDAQKDMLLASLGSLLCLLALHAARALRAQRAVAMD